MTSTEITAWRWLFHQPKLNEFQSRSFPSDEVLNTSLDLIWENINPRTLEAIRRRSILYSRAGCAKDSCVKSAVVDFVTACKV